MLGCLKCKYENCIFICWCPFSYFLTKLLWCMLSKNRSYCRRNEWPWPWSWKLRRSPGSINGHNYSTLVADTARIIITCAHWVIVVKSLPSRVSCPVMTLCWSLYANIASDAYHPSSLLFYHFMHPHVFYLHCQWKQALSKLLSLLLSWYITNKDFR